MRIKSTSLASISLFCRPIQILCSIFRIDHATMCIIVSHCSLGPIYSCRYESNTIQSCLILSHLGITTL
jgi:hypothetical protein